MKKKLLLLSLISLSLSASDYAVQVMALKKATTPTKATLSFFKKYEKKGIHLNVIHENGWTKIEFSKFKTLCSATIFSQKMQKSATPDSFVKRIQHIQKNSKELSPMKKKYIKHSYDEDFQDPYADNIVLPKTRVKRAQEHQAFYNFYSKQCQKKLKR